MSNAYFVYIMANHNGSLYIGITNDALRRVWEHRTGAGSIHAATYHITRLVYLEECGSVADAIAREKQLKGWRREKKLALIPAQNPEWRDLAEEALGPMSSIGARFAVEGGELGRDPGFGGARSLVCGLGRDIGVRTAMAVARGELAP